MLDYTIYLDGNILNKSDYAKLDDFTIVERLGSDGNNGIATSFTGDFEFSGAAYDIIKSQLACNDYPSTTSIPFVIQVICKGEPKTVFDGRIYGSDVSYCVNTKGTCTITVGAKADDVKTRAVSCLKNIRITQNVNGAIATSGVDEYRAAPTFEYCENKGFDTLIFGSLLLNIVIVIQIVISALNAVIGLVGGNEINWAPLEGWVGFITGCDGRKHRAPFIHSYLRNISKLCGLTLQSSIFDAGGYYHNLTRLDCAYDKSSDNITEINNTFNTKNFPNLNGVQFLDSFKDFAIKWLILDGVLYVEREDFLPSNDLIDLTTEPTCYEFTDETPPAYSNYKYSLDTVDTVGDRSNPNYVQRGQFIDWNNPINPAQSGAKERTFLFGTPTFVNDIFNETGLAIESIYGELILQTIGFNPDGLLVLEDGTAALPKLLMWDGTSPIANARVERIYIPAPNLYAYNAKMWVSIAGTLGGVPMPQNIYEKLLIVDDPRTTQIQQREFETETAFCCDDFGTYVGRAAALKDLCGDRIGIISEAEYDFETNKLKIKGKA